MPGRFEERLANGPVIVGDGGMGALVTSAVPRLRCPEEANLRRAVRERFGLPRLTLFR